MRRGVFNYMVFLSCKVLSIKKEDAVLAKHGNADDCYSRGEAYHLCGDSDRAMEAYLEALRVDPNHTMAYYGLYWVYIRLGLKDEAIESYKRYLACLRLDLGRSRQGV